MKRLATALVVSATFFGAGTPTEAQVRLAPELVLADDVDFGIGAHAFFPLGESNIEIGAFYDFYFVAGNAGYSDLGGTAYYLFRLPDNPGIVPKVGAGLTVGFVTLDSNFASVDGATEFGAHVSGGVDFTVGANRPFVEVGVNLTSELPQWLIRAGWGFELGGS